MESLSEGNNANGRTGYSHPGSYCHCIVHNAAKNFIS